MQRFVTRTAERLTSEVWKYFDILEKPKKENDPDNENDPKNPDDNENDPENPKFDDDEPERCKCRTLRSLPGRVCLTFDLWTSIATNGYMSLTAHFIDANWVLHMRFLNFSYMPPPHSGVALKEKVYDLLGKWGIENKLFSFTLDNASANDVLVDLLKNHLNLNSALVDKGSCFHNCCYVHILNLVVQVGLKEIDVVDKIRECVKNMKGSQARKQKLLDCVAQYSLDFKRGLRQDVPTRWKSTYLMLASAIYYRHAFASCNLVTRILSIVLLKRNGVCAIQFLLNKEMNSTDPFMRKMATQIMVKFDKYWSEHSVILAIAVIFDPHFKFQLVEYSYGKLYEIDNVKLDDVIEDIMNLNLDNDQSESVGCSSSVINVEP
ncbi:hypothetical protein RHGRI_005483 [Rhododendron griersonianum]|uniref:hAT-like transposase RNase-H fold domain-containing protein n=1 Tax=Rhododendron griersonianum TaxID=479676 RepID=A0AAV6LED3_9ERIC|nr:hypothetical protein RHGRI_005483 [Rhododendron griersonianum]